MSERWVLLAAAAAAAGALAARPVPWLVAAAAGALALLTWRSIAFVLAVAIACSLLAARAEAGLAVPRVERVHGWATLVSDPREVHGGALRVDVELGARRWQAWARGPAAGALRDRLAGEQALLTGRTGPFAPRTAERLRWRHIAGRMTVDEVSAHRPGRVHARLANGIRRTLSRGSAGLGSHDRALLAGFVLGDDREQPADLADDFRAAGLTHLLAVSGQNVAFVLLLAAPVLRRLGPRARLAGAAVLLGLFGTVTRWEPSVVRAVAMAGVAMWAATSGRPVTSRRALALAVTMLLLIDPLLVHSVGFVLSAGACLGIAVLGQPVARRLPGPDWLRLPLAVTVAAQAGVSPVLVPVFGGVPVASLPANLLAAPAAGPVMVWGLGAGIVAGVAGPPFDGALHLPSRLLLGWVRWVASTTAALPLGELRAGHVMVLGLLALIAWRAPRLVRPAVVGAVVVALVPAVALLRAGDLDRVAVARGAWLWRQESATVLALEGEPHGPTLLQGLRRRGVRRLDVVVISGRSSLGALDTLRTRHAIRRVAAPRQAQVSDATPLEEGDQLRVGSLALVVTHLEPRLRLAVAGAAGTGRPGGAG